MLGNKIKFMLFAGYWIFTPITFPTWLFVLLDYEEQKSEKALDGSKLLDEKMIFLQYTVLQRVRCGDKE